MPRSNKTLDEAIVQTLTDCQTRVFSHSALEHVMAENRYYWELPQKATLTSLIQHMSTQGLRRAEFAFPSRREIRYLWGEPSMLEIAQSLKPNAYLAHNAAVYIHGLASDDAPDPIYINQEQSRPHVRNADLSQEGIDRAFANNARLSNEVAVYNGVRFVVVHGQRTGALGVEEKKGLLDETLRVTSIERTLVDIAVRPAYSGGTARVLEAYRRAKGRLSIKKLAKILDTMNFVYPFHQAIGFYLDRSGVAKPAELKSFYEREAKFDFYLDYKIDNPEYSEKWKLYYPANL